MKDRRNWLKANWDELEAQGSDQQRRVAYPPLEQPGPAATELIELPPVAELQMGTMPLAEAIARRESRRKWSAEPVKLAELAWLLWATQGVRSVPASGAATLRTVPSGGARHTFETYLVVQSVVELEPGLYRYLALSHRLARLRLQADIGEQAGEACLKQRTVSRAAVTFIWSTVPYRAEWRYGVAAHKMIAIDAGHVCQNAYLGCEALGLGCCAIGAYDQGLVDKLIGVDGEDELAIYACAVGRPM
ncbi:SagB/ThcOx family dehydrogenase [bacterium]|nr:SagB/ThcOx family dehydrogenase [bacterium]